MPVVKKAPPGPPILVTGNATDQVSLKVVVSFLVRFASCPLLDDD